MATLSCILAWRTPWSEEPSGLQSSWAQKKSDRAEAAKHACTEKLHLFMSLGVGAWTPRNDKMVERGS